jgi:hypothetical protein
VAGYSHKNAKVSAHRLLRQEAVAREVNRLNTLKMRSLAPKAVATVSEIMDDKSDAPTRLRAARTVLERSDPVVRTENQTNVNVLVQQQQPSGDELALRVMKLAKEVGWSDEMLRSALGANTNFPLLERRLAGEPVVEDEREPMVIDVQAEAVADVVDEPIDPDEDDGDDTEA